MIILGTISIFISVNCFSQTGYVQAWITLGRAQLNFGEPDSAIESFDSALAIKVWFQDIIICSSQRFFHCFVIALCLGNGPSIESGTAI